MLLDEGNSGPMRASGEPVPKNRQALSPTRLAGYRVIAFGTWRGRLPMPRPCRVRLKFIDSNPHEF